MTYDVTVLTLRPGATPRALPTLGKALEAQTGRMLACWYSDLGALNRILILTEHDASTQGAEARAALAREADLFGIGEFIMSVTFDTFVQFPFVEKLQAGASGPVFEVRTYSLKPDGLQKTMDLWRKAVPGRVTLSPLLAAMYSVTGTAPRFMHIWPYKSLDERQRIRAKSVEAGLWPPPGGPDHLVTMQSDVYLPAPFSPIR